MSQTLTNPLLCVSSYARIFRIIEQAAQAAERLEPHEAYALYDDYLVRYRLDPVIYLSMAITSGGYRRDPGLKTDEVIARNSAFGSLAAQALVSDIPEFDLDDIVVPAELGKVNGWSQLDYLLFWFHVIVGVRSDEAMQIELIVGEAQAARDVEVDPRHLTERDYSRLVQDYIDALHRVADESPEGLQPNNMQAVLFVLDADMSLGAQAEAMLCEAIGIPPQFQVINASTLAQAGETFVQHRNALCGLGARVLGGDVNRDPIFSFLGVSKGEPLTRVKRGLRPRMRKTSLINALLVKEYYGRHPGRRPPRHGGYSLLPEMS